MDFLSFIVNLNFLFLCLGISAIVFVFKTIIEFIFKFYSRNKFVYKLWKNLLLPLMPVLIGVLVLFDKTYPFPENFNGIISRSMFGLTAGLFSGLVYRLIKELIIKKGKNV